MTFAKSTTGEKYKLVPPEGGWGYIVAAGQVITITAIFGAVAGFGLIFNDFLKEIGVGTSIVAVLTSCTSVSLSISGLFCNTLAEKLTTRLTGVMAAIIYCSGTIFQLFAYSAWPLFVASILHGFALGIIMPIIFATFNYYFVERRTFMTSVTNIIIGLGQVAAPLTAHYLLETFGFRGCILILVGTSFHAILGMLVMHPVEWHMKKITINGTNISDKLNGKRPETLDDAENGHQLTPLVEHNRSETKNPNSTEQTTKVASIINNRRSIKVNSSRNSVKDAVSFTGSLVISELGEQDKVKTKKNIIERYLDVSLMKDPRYAVLTVGLAFTMYSDFSFGFFQPLHLLEIEFTQAEVSRILAIGTAGDLVSRCVLTAFAAVKSFPPKIYYSGALFFLIVARIAFLYLHGFWAMATVNAIIGFMKTWITVPVPLIYGEYLPKEKFAAGYGLYMFLSGIFQLISGPLVRFIKESTGTYVAVFHFLNSLLILNLAIWAVEYLWLRFRVKKNRNLR